MKTYHFPIPNDDDYEVHGHTDSLDKSAWTVFSIKGARKYDKSQVGSLKKAVDIFIQELHL